MKLWNASIKTAREEYTKAIHNTELMRKDYQKYSKEVQNKLEKFNEACREDKKYKTLQFSLIITQIAFIKEIQTNLFKNGVQLITKTTENIEDIEARYKEKETFDEIYNLILKHYRDTLTKILKHVSEQMETACNIVNNNLDLLEKYSDVSPIVFADPKIENKHKRNDNDFITIHHSDIAKFVKDYKLVGIEYDKRIKLVDADEIKHRLVKKIGEIIQKWKEKGKK